MWQKEQVIHEFQKRGKRITGQREMLLDVILEGNWSSCKDVYYEARKRDPKLGMATGLPDGKYPGGDRDSDPDLPLFPAAEGRINSASALLHNTSAPAVGPKSMTNRPV